MQINLLIRFEEFGPLCLKINIISAPFSPFLLDSQKLVCFLSVPQVWKFSFFCIFFFFSFCSLDLITSTDQSSGSPILNFAYSNFLLNTSSKFFLSYCTFSPTSIYIHIYIYIYLISYIYIFYNLYCSQTFLQFFRYGCLRSLNIFTIA